MLHIDLYLAQAGLESVYLFNGTSQMSRVSMAAGVAQVRNERVTMPFISGPAMSPCCTKFRQ
jgi:hypothetical protein